MVARIGALILAVLWLMFGIALLIVGSLLFVFLDIPCLVGSELCNVLQPHITQQLFFGQIDPGQVFMFSVLLPVVMLLFSVVALVAGTEFVRFTLARHRVNVVAFGIMVNLLLALLAIVLYFAVQGVGFAWLERLDRISAADDPDSPRQQVAVLEPLPPNEVPPLDMLTPVYTGGALILLIAGIGTLMLLLNPPDPVYAPSSARQCERCGLRSYHDETPSCIFCERKVLLGVEQKIIPVPPDVSVIDLNIHLGSKRKDVPIYNPVIEIDSTRTPLRYSGREPNKWINEAKTAAPINTLRAPSAQADETLTVQFQLPQRRFQIGRMINHKLIVRAADGDEWFGADLKSGGHEEVIVQIERGEWRIEKAVRALWRLLRRSRSTPLLLLMSFVLLSGLTKVQAQIDLVTNTPPAVEITALAADFFTRPALCNDTASYNCVSLYDQNVTISRIQSLATVPVYQNPLLQAELKITNLGGAPETIIYLDKLREFGRDDSHFCPLLIAGITTAPDYDYQTYTILQTASGSSGFKVQLYAYCRTPGLPNSVRSFPIDSQVIYDTARPISQQFTDPSSEKIDQYKTVLNPDRTAECQVDYFDLLMQLTLYRLDQPDLNFYAAGIPLYDRYQNAVTQEAGQSEGDQMQCLLKDTGVPDFTQTPTPTATSTNVVSTPVISPTPTPVPVLDGVVGTMPGGSAPLTFGQVILGLAAIAIAVVTLLTIPALPRPALRVLLLVAVVIAAGLVAFFVIGRVNAQENPLPETKPPPLLMVILLDNSSTMTGNNSAGTTGHTTLRAATDASNYRAQAVERLLLHLQADSVQHKVAVLSFAAAAGDLRPLSRDSTGNFGFVDVGGGASADTIIQALQNQRGTTPGPGDVKSALAMAKDILQPQLDNNTAAVFKPVVLLITDDVPLNSPFNASVWGGVTNAWRTYLGNIATGVQGLETDMQFLADQDRFTGYCRPPKGGVSYGVFAMGAANWISTAGSIDTSGMGSYYPDLLTALGSVAPLTGQPLNYRIDPLFSSEGQLLNDFRDAIPRFLRDVRCEDETPRLLPEPDTARAQLDVPVSALYQSVTLTLDVPRDQHPIVTLADGSTLNPASDTHWGDNQDTLVYFADPSRSGFAGLWHVLLSGVGSEKMSVQMNAAADLSALRVDSQTDEKTISSANDSEYKFRLIAHDLPLDAASDPILNTNPSGSLKRTGLQPVQIVFHGDSSGQYTGIIPKEAIASPDTYHLSLELTTQKSFLVNGIAQNTYTLPLADFTVGSSFSMGEVDPGFGDQWKCQSTLPDGRSGEYVQVHLNVSAPDDSSPRAQALRESMYTFTSISLYYPPVSNLAANATPVATLTWNGKSSAENGAFEGVVPCDPFMNSETIRQVEIRPQFPNGISTPVNVDFVFTPSPTSTATSTPTPTPTSLAPLPSPPPPETQIVQDTVYQLTRPIVAFGIVVVGLTTVIALVLLLGRAYLRFIAPLHAIRYQTGENGLVKGLLPIWRRFLPGWSYTISSADRAKTPYFKIGATTSGLIVTARMNCVVNSQVLKANSSTRPITREKIIIFVDEAIEQRDNQPARAGQQFVLYNRRVSIR